MIVIDTSAVVTIALKEPQAPTCMDVMIQADGLLISAGTLAELLIVASRRNFEKEAKTLIADLHVEVVPVTAASAQRVAQAYRQLG